MANNKLYVIIGLAVALILAGILLPIGLNDLVTYDGSFNATASGGTEGTNSTMATLVGTVLPVMIVISIVLSLVALVGKKNGGSVA